MSGWTIAMIVGAVVLAGLGVLCVVIMRAIRATAETTQELARALEEVQANTAALSRLDHATEAIQRASRSLTDDLRQAGEAPPPR